MKLLQPLQVFLTKSKVQKQLYFFFFTAIFIPVTFIGTVLLLNTKKLMTSHYQNQVESDNLRVKSIIFDLTLSLYNISEDLCFDTELQNLLSAEYVTDNHARASLGEYKRIDKIIKTETAISTLTIYTLNKSINDYGHILEAGKEIQKTDWFQDVQKRSNGFWRYNVRHDALNNEYGELTLYRKIFLPKINSYAVLVISVSNNYLKNRIENNTFHTILAANDYPVFYSSDQRQIGKALSLNITYNQQYFDFLGKLRYGDYTALTCISTLVPYKTDDSIYIFSLDLKAYRYILRFTLSYSMLLLLVLLVVTGIIYLFSRYFSTRVGTLRYAMHQASNGIYETADSFKGDDELSETFSDLKVMINKIKEKENRIYQTQIKEQNLINQQQKMEFKMLASQINPHFLYNTLETIRMKALTAGNQNVATAIKLLGKSMRYVLENTGTSSTTLKKEIDYIETYLAIQKLRFPDRINATIKIQSGFNIEDYHILPLLLQPIVENAIVHGLEGVEENGKIIIHIKEYDNTILHIDIFDNGMGMTEQELSLLMKHISCHNRTSAESIGLYNINQRIHLCYGPAYGFAIKSRKNAGTLVTLSLPLLNTQEVLL